MSDSQNTDGNQEIAAKLVAAGVDPAKAADVARRTKRPPKTERQPDLFAPPPAPVQQKQLPATRPAEASLLDTAGVILQDEPTGSDIAYLHAILCQVGLPRGPKAVEGLQVFERICGGAALRVTAGALWDGKQLVQQPIPYGANPRLVLAWLNTQAVKTRSPIIPVGDSAAEFLRMLGKESTGGKNGTLTNLAQWERS